MFLHHRMCRVKTRALRWPHQFGSCSLQLCCLCSPHTPLVSGFIPPGLCLLPCALPSWFHSPSSPVLCHICTCVRARVHSHAQVQRVHRTDQKAVSPGSFPGNLCHLRLLSCSLPYFYPFPAHSFASNFSTWSLLARAPAPHFISLRSPVNRLLLPGTPSPAPTLLPSCSLWLPARASVPCTVACVVLSLCCDAL